MINLRIESDVILKKRLLVLAYALIAIFECLVAAVIEDGWLKFMFAFSAFFWGICVGIFIGEERQK